MKEKKHGVHADYRYTPPAEDEVTCTKARVLNHDFHTVSLRAVRQYTSRLLKWWLVNLNLKQKIIDYESLYTKFSIFANVKDESYPMI